MLDVKQNVMDRADDIAEALKRGKDVEIRRSKDGITVAAVSKKVIKIDGNGWEEVSK
jgi:hypothetical protein